MGDPYRRHYDAGRSGVGVPPPGPGHSPENLAYQRGRHDAYMERQRSAPGSSGGADVPPAFALLALPYVFTGGLISVGGMLSGASGMPALAAFTSMLALPIWMVLGWGVGYWMTKSTENAGHLVAFVIVALLNFYAMTL